MAMKRYIAFLIWKNENVDSFGGWSDAVPHNGPEPSSFDTIEEARSAIDKETKGCPYFHDHEKQFSWHIVDLKTGNVVLDDPE